MSICRIIINLESGRCHLSKANRSSRHFLETAAERFVAVWALAVCQTEVYASVTSGPASFPVQWGCISAFGPLPCPLFSFQAVLF